MIHFDNNGLIPVEGFTVMGVNAKEGGNSIGFFGTGLKIAIASILRLRGAVTIHVGGDVYKFLIKMTEIRGKPFEIVCAELNGDKLLEFGYTTELGKNWEPWMVMREFESNCRDEGGTSGKGMGKRGEGKTSIWITCPVVEAAYDDLSDYFLCAEPIYKHKEFEIYRGASNHFFYRGIRVGLFGKTMPFTFNFTNARLQCRLTEDRQMASIWTHNTLACGLPEITDAKIIHELFPNHHMNESMVYDLDFDQDYNFPSDAFWERILENHRVNMLSVPTSIFELMLKHGKISHDQARNILPFDTIEEKMLVKARQFLSDMGYDPAKYPIKKAHLGTEIHGLADGIHKTILISPNAFSYGTKYICSTVFEEYLHLYYGFADCSRAMQNYLFERLATTMEKHYYKSPL